MTLVARLFSFEEMRALQGVCMLTIQRLLVRSGRPCGEIYRMTGQKYLSVKEESPAL